MDKPIFDKNDKKELTPQEIESYKEKYGKIYLISVEDKKAYIHKPDRNTLDLASLASRNKDSKFNETILINCWLAGDKEIVQDDEYFYPAGKQLNEIVKYKESELKEL